MAAHHGSISFFDDPADTKHYYTDHMKAIAPDMSNVAAIKLYNWYKEMEEALNDDDFFLHDTMHNSMFPSWIPEEQPDKACYAGQFPYGYWEINNG